MNPNDLPKQYDPKAAQDRWYAFWLERGYFHADPASGKPPFCMVIPPPNVTGALHLGHYAGSLRTRLALQGRVAQTLLVADLQALTDNAGRAARVADHVFEVVLDYLAVGIDPARTTIAVQSRLPALAELTMLYLNLVTVARLERNPTVKEEIEQRGFAAHIQVGVLLSGKADARQVLRRGTRPHRQRMLRAKRVPGAANCVLNLRGHRQCLEREAHPACGIPCRFDLAAIEALERIV